jgi:hypothetical protein
MRRWIMSFRNISWDDEQKSLRGSFVNMAITLIYAILISLGTVFSQVAENLAKMETFLIGFFAVSFSIWAGKKVIENMQDVSTTADAVTSTFTKLGIKIPGTHPEEKKEDAAK